MGVESTKNNSYEHFCSCVSRVESTEIGFKLIPSKTKIIRGSFDWKKNKTKKLIKLEEVNIREEYSS